MTLPLVAGLLRHGLEPADVAAGIAADVRSPAEHLLGRVLALLPPSISGVLLRAAVADELWPGLVTAVTDRSDAPRLLDWLAAGSTGVELAPGGPGGLRLPSLVRELLVAELAVTDPDAHAAADRAAAGWYAAAELLPEAVTHAVAAGDWAGAATLLVDDLAVAALLARSGPPEAELLTAARPPLRGADAALLRTAATLGRTGAVDPAELAGAAAEPEAPGGSPRPAWRASTLLLAAAAVAAADTPPHQALAAIDAAQAQADGLVTARPERRAELDAVLATARASALLATDADEPALVDCVEAAEQACAAAGTERLRAGRLADLALLQALTGRLNQAEALVAEYEALCELHDVPRATRSAMASTAAAWISSERDQAADARRWAARAAESGSHRRAVYTAPLLAVLESRRLRLRGRLDLAERALAAVPAGDRLPHWVREQLVAESVRLRLARGEPDALRPLDTLPGASPRAGVLRAAAAQGVAPASAAPPEGMGTQLAPVLTVELQLVRAAVLASDGQTGAATAVLAAALQAAEPEQLRRPFLEALPAVQELLRTTPAGRRWLAAPAGPAPPAVPPAPATGTPLSDREREALAWLADGLSTSGVAAAMGVSTNTARGHLRSLARKLGAADRADLLRRAAEEQRHGNP